MILFGAADTFDELEKFIALFSAVSRSYDTVDRVTRRNRKASISRRFEWELSYMATRNTLIDAQQGRSFARANEVISTNRSSLLLFAASTLASFASSRVACRVSSSTDVYVHTHTHTYTLHGCANAKYVGRNFLFCPAVLKLASCFCARLSAGNA